MRRLSEKELTIRIHKFLDRKTAQFPDIEPAANRLVRDWQESERNDYTNKEPTVRWSLQLS